ncbi:hypothetical protein [Sphingorhabdus sp. Alg239-R122]|uniref:hypothetical protein n=1 Tax=Sphingorhabdus sp. Alg239-R122 TaxID=2305989 RepID=UPI0013DBFA18|nr:hypothetical protein [Sphingorhabdus sp. Alg239-R122]
MENSEEQIAAWSKKAEMNDYRCDICGELIGYDERETYFETKYCATHANRMSKDD